MAEGLKKLNIIGAGRVGKTLGRLWHDTRQFAVGGIASRTAAGAQKAGAFIGAGTDIDNIASLPSADIFMIATPDDAIEEVCGILAEKQALDGKIVFHCSGALPSSILRAAKNKGAFVASVHPVKSVADPADSIRTFAGTWCCVEGDKEALAALIPALEKIGAKTFPIDPAQKTSYHTASVFICNGLNALLEAGFGCYERAGVPRETAIEITSPIIAETIRNIQTKGSAAALTGPVSRGDMKLVAQQLQSLKNWNAEYAALYEQITNLLVKLTQGQRMAA